AFLFQANEALLNRLHTSAKGGYQSLVPLPSQPVKDTAIAQHFRWHTVKLGQVNAVDAKTLQRGQRGGTQPLLAIVVWVKSAGPAQFCGNEDIRVGLAEATERPFALAVPVAICSIEEAHTRVVRGVQRFLCDGVIPRDSPGTA